MENTLSTIRGVLDVKARLINESSGETTIFYDPSRVTLEDLKQAIPTASGDKHAFRLISVIEENREQ